MAMVIKRRCDGFSKRVDDLYARAIAGTATDASGEKREVREVAFALAALRKLIDGAYTKVKLPDLPETALVAASDLLDSLVTGTNHPIWRFIEDGKSRKRPNRAPTSSIQKLRQGFVIGILRALQTDATPTLSKRAAARLIATHSCQLDTKLTTDQIISWDKTFLELQDDLPNAVRGDILNIALKIDGNQPQLPLGNITPMLSHQQILRIGFGRAYYLWRIPDKVELKA
jgi:hypothetical protein